MLSNDVRRERDDLKGLSNSPQLASGVGMDELDADQENDVAGQDDAMERFVENVKTDAYVRESMAILSDLAAMQTAVASKDQ